jgi:hypothetical protein
MSDGSSVELDQVIAAIMREKAALDLPDQTFSTGSGASPWSMSSVIPVRRRPGAAHGPSFSLAAAFIAP